MHKKGENIGFLRNLRATFLKKVSHQKGEWKVLCGHTCSICNKSNIRATFTEQAESQSDQICFRNDGRKRQRTRWPPTAMPLDPSPSLCPTRPYSPCTKGDGSPALAPRRPPCASPSASARRPHAMSETPRTSRRHHWSSHRRSCSSASRPDHRHQRLRAAMRSSSTTTTKPRRSRKLSIRI